MSLHKLKFKSFRWKHIKNQLVWTLNSVVHKTCYHKFNKQLQKKNKKKQNKNKTKTDKQTKTTYFTYQNENLYLNQFSNSFIYTCL